MSIVLAHQSRGKTVDITFQDGDGDTVTPTESDKIRATILRKGETAKLTVSSDSPTSNGSSFTKGAANRLRLDASDLNFDPGTYSLIIDFYDASDSSEWKMVQRQVFHLLTVEG